MLAPQGRIEDDRDVNQGDICGSGFHLMNSYMPTMASGDVLGHETISEVEVGKGQSKFKVGDRVVVPFNMDRTNRNAENAIEALGHSPSGLFG